MDDVLDHGSQRRGAFHTFACYPPCRTLPAHMNQMGLRAVHLCSGHAKPFVNTPALSHASVSSACASGPAPPTRAHVRLCWIGSPAAEKPSTASCGVKRRSSVATGTDPRASFGRAAPIETYMRALESTSVQNCPNAKQFATRGSTCRTAAMSTGERAGSPVQKNIL